MAIACKGDSGAQKSTANRPLQSFPSWRINLASFESVETSWKLLIDATIEALPLKSRDQHCSCSFHTGVLLVKERIVSLLDGVEESVVDERCLDLVPRGENEVLVLEVLGEKLVGVTGLSR